MKLAPRAPTGLAIACWAAACSSAPPPAADPGPPPAPRADLILVGGTVRTMDPDRPTATALAVRDGVVLAVGDDSAVSAHTGPDTRVIDLAGRTVVPGLIDAHMHLRGLGERRFGVNLVGTRSLEEIKQKIAAAATSAPAGTWIRGRGWDQNDWPSRRRRAFPTASDLDAVSPDHPVVLTRIDGHALWANRRAMEAAGVDRSTPSPSGGRIVKKRGRPTGIFVDNAMRLILDRMPALSRREIEQAILLGQRECLAAGLVGVHDMGTDLETIEVLRDLDQRGELKLRAYVMHDGQAEDLSRALEGGPLIPDEPGPRRLTVRGVKFYIDGALGSRGAALFTPYRDARKHRGLLMTEPAVFEARVRTAAERGFQVATHAIGDRGNRIVLDTYARVFEGRGGETRPRIEHAQVVAVDDIPRFGRQGVIASMQPTHATSDMPWAQDRVGPERIRGAYAWQSLRTSSATIAAGSDAPVEDISVILGLYAAITRKDQFGQPDGGWFPEQRLTPAQALHAFTWGAAYASFREDVAGRLAKGRSADITVLDIDPLEASEDDLLKTQVMLTIVGGEVAFARPGADLPPSTTSTASARP